MSSPAFHTPNPTGLGNGYYTPVDTPATSASSGSNYHTPMTYHTPGGTPIPSGKPTRQPIGVSALGRSAATAALPLAMSPAVNGRTALAQTPTSTLQQKIADVAAKRKLRENRLATILQKQESRRASRDNSPKTPRRPMAATPLRNVAELAARPAPLSFLSPVNSPLKLPSNRVTPVQHQIVSSPSITVMDASPTQENKLVTPVSVRQPVAHKDMTPDHPDVDVHIEEELCRLERGDTDLGRSKSPTSDFLQFSETHSTARSEGSPVKSTPAPAVSQEPSRRPTPIKVFRDTPEVAVIRLAKYGAVAEPSPSRHRASPIDSPEKLDKLVSLSTDIIGDLGYRPMIKQAFPAISATSPSSEAAMSAAAADLSLAVAVAVDQSSPYGGYYSGSDASGTEDSPSWRTTLADTRRRAELATAQLSNMNRSFAEVSLDESVTEEALTTLNQQQNRQAELEQKIRILASKANRMTTPVSEYQRAEERQKQLLDSIRILKAKAMHSPAPDDIIIPPPDDIIIPPPDYEEEFELEVDNYHARDHELEIETDVIENAPASRWAPTQLTVQLEKEEGSFGFNMIAGSKGRKGVLIKTTLTDGPAYAAGVLPSDRVMQINGLLVEDLEPAEVFKIIREGGDVCTLVILRSNQFPVVSRMKAHSGVTVIDAKIYSPLKRFGFATKARPAPAFSIDVSDVTDGGAAYQGGIRRGDEIVAVNRIPVRGVRIKDVIKLIKQDGSHCQLRLHRRDPPPPDFGVAPGEHVVEVTLSGASADTSLNMIDQEGEGIVVSWVQHGGPADTGGVLEDDVVMSVNQQSADGGTATAMFTALFSGNATNMLRLKRKIGARKRSPRKKTPSPSTTPTPGQTPGPPLRKSPGRSPRSLLAADSNLLTINIQKQGGSYGFTIADANDRGGVFAKSLVSGGPAVHAGLLVDDRLVAVDGRNVERMRGTTVVGLVRAAGAQITLIVSRGALSVDPEETPALEHTFVDFVITKAKGTYGFQIHDAGDRQGAFVFSVAPNGAARAAGMEVGDTILAVSGRSMAGKHIHEVLQAFKIAPAKLLVKVLRSVHATTTPPGFVTLAVSVSHQGGVSFGFNVTNCNGREKNGILVERVVRGSPAAMAGVSVDDQVVGIDDARMDHGSATDVQRAVVKVGKSDGLLKLLLRRRVGAALPLSPPRSKVPVPTTAEFMETTSFSPPKQPSSSPKQPGPIVHPRATPKTTPTRPNGPMSPATPGEPSFLDWTPRSTPMANALRLLKTVSPKKRPDTGPTHKIPPLTPYWDRKVYPKPQFDAHNVAELLDEHAAEQEQAEHTALTCIVLFQSAWRKTKGDASSTTLQTAIKNLQTEVLGAVKLRRRHDRECNEVLRHGLHKAAMKTRARVLARLDFLPVSDKERVTLKALLRDPTIRSNTKAALDKTKALEDKYEGYLLDDVLNFVANTWDALTQEDDVVLQQISIEMTGSDRSQTTSRTTTPISPTQKNMRESPAPRKNRSPSPAGDLQGITPPPSGVVEETTDLDNAISVGEALRNPEINVGSEISDAPESIGQVLRKARSELGSNGVAGTLLHKHGHAQESNIESELGDAHPESIGQVLRKARTERGSNGVVGALLHKHGHSPQAPCKLAPVHSDHLVPDADASLARTQSKYKSVSDEMRAARERRGSKKTAGTIAGAFLKVRVHPYRRLWSALLVKLACFVCVCRAIAEPAFSSCRFPPFSEPWESRIGSFGVHGSRN